MKGLLALACLWAGLPLSAQDSAALGNWPVFWEGRAMPLETAARVMLEGAAGDNSWEGQPALAVLRGFWSDPTTWIRKPIFFVRNPSVLKLLGQDSGREGHFSLEQLQGARIMDREPLGDPKEDVLRLSSAMGLWESVGATFTPGSGGLSLVPGRDRWLTPWEALSAPDPWQREVGQLWLYWEFATRNGAVDEINRTTRSLESRLSQNPYGFVPWITVAEAWTDRIPILPLAVLFWALALAAGFWNREALGRILVRILVGTGWLALSWLLVLKMLVTGRPPVTNLGTTFLFVGWILGSVHLTLWWVGKQRSELQTLVLGAGLVVIGFSAVLLSGGDPFAPVQAVLASNFWLMVHVLTIILGYGATVLVSAVGHGLAWRLISRPADSHDRWYQLLAILIPIALLLLVAGTLLGGFWANQSWGAFWSWDPKETGVLAVILWVALVLHLRFSGLVKSLGFALGAALSSVPVALSWIGVNLLAKGMHSYGWDDTAAWILGLLVIGESGFLSFCFVRLKMKP